MGHYVLGHICKFDLFFFTPLIALLRLRPIGSFQHRLGFDKLSDITSPLLLSVAVFSVFINLDSGRVCLHSPFRV